MMRLMIASCATKLLFIVLDIIVVLHTVGHHASIAPFVVRVLPLFLVQVIGATRSWVVPGHTPPQPS